MLASIQRPGAKGLWLLFFVASPLVITTTMAEEMEAIAENPEQQSAASNSQAETSQAPEEESADGAAARSAPQPRFNIWQYEVRGATVLPVGEIQKTLYSYLGPGLSLSTVEEAANALVALYDSKGYAAAVDIPPQDVVNGVVVLEVSEGTVSRVNVSGARYFLPSKIRDSVPSVKEGGKLQAGALQKDIARLNRRSPDLRVTPALSPGKRPGELEVDLRVYDELPVSGSLTLNDHYSAYTSKLRLSGSVSFDNLWQSLHSLTLWGLTNPEETDESKVYSLTYGLPVGERNRLSLNYIRSDSSTDTVIPTANTPGTGPASGPAVAAGDATLASLNYLIRPVFSDNTQFRLGFNYKDVEEDIIPDDASDAFQDTDTTRTPIEYFTLTGGIDHSYSGDSHRGSLGAGFTASFRELNNAEEFADKRENARRSFFILNGYFSHRWSLPADFAVQAGFSGQYTEQPLISNEQWRAGGSTSVRGYLESQELGDYGFDSTLQLETPSVLSGTDHSLLFHAFYDYGYAATKPVDRTVFLNPDGTPDPGSQTESARLASYGIGFQYQFRRLINASLDWATAARDSCATLSESEEMQGVRLCSKEGDVEDGDTRVTFNITSQF